MEKLACESREKSDFAGVRLYAKHGRIVSRDAAGFRDAESAAHHGEHRFSAGLS